MTVTTSNVVVTRSGSSFTIDVTACNLDSNTAIKDFIVLHDNVQVTTTNYTKTTATTLTYSGSSLPSTLVEIRRKTTASPIITVSYASQISSASWNNEIDRLYRLGNEWNLNGAGAAFSGTLPNPRDDAYPTGWSGDTTYPPTRNAAYNIINTLAPKASPVFTGDPQVPDLSGIGVTGNTIVNADSMQAELALKANLASPSLTGTPVAPTATAGTNTTQLATTAFYQNSRTKMATQTGGAVASTSVTSGAGNETAMVSMSVTIGANHLGSLVFFNVDAFPTASLGSSHTVYVVTQINSVSQLYTYARVLANDAGYISIVGSVWTSAQSAGSKTYRICFGELSATRTFGWDAPTIVIVSFYS